MAGAQSNPVTELALAGFVVVLILILLIEMPTWVIDFSIALNITLGIVLLMISLYIQKPLELAAFPSIILINNVITEGHFFKKRSENIHDRATRVKTCGK